MIVAVDPAVTCNPASAALGHRAPWKTVLASDPWKRETLKKSRFSEEKF